MARTRRKSAAQEAPQTLEQAVALLGQYRDLVDMVDDLADERDRAIARIKGEYDLIAAPIGVRAQDMFRQLRAWWAVAGEELTGGKRKSAPLAGVIIGERTTPPSLQLPKGKNVDDIVAVLLAHFGDTYVVTSHKLDKPPIIRALREPVDGLDAEEDRQFLAEIAVLSGLCGLSVSQKEEFFIDRPDKPAAVEVVAEEAEA